jgi:hypothetical protein
MDPALTGSWEAPFDMGGIAIHAIHTHVGEILFFQYVEGTPGDDHTSFVGTWNYSSGLTAEAPFTFERDVFCAGNNILPDGRVYIAGGHDHYTGERGDPAGVAETDTYDATTRTWTPGPLLTEKRWYPTNVGMPNGTTLVFGGHALPGIRSDTVDRYDPVANTITQLPATATQALGDYPHMHLVRNGSILRAGPPRRTSFFDPATNSWENGARMQFGARNAGNSVLLPGGDRVMVVGGQDASDTPPTGTAEILDCSALDPEWQYTGSLNHPRQLANTVILPDGQVLIVGGGAQFAFTDPVRIPEVYDPTTGLWTALAPQQASRMYHSTALLLPDGRVLSAGEDNGGLATFGEIFSPPYLFKGPRPTITSAPTSIGYGQQLTITTPDAAAISGVALIKPGAVTHQIDSDQRYVGLSFTVGVGTLTASSPTDGNLAPPGYYMLFIVNSSGVPSVASWVHVS